MWLNKDCKMEQDRNKIGTKYVKYEQRIQFRQKINKKLPFIKNIKLSFWKK